MASLVNNITTREMLLLKHNIPIIQLAIGNEVHYDRGEI